MDDGIVAIILIPIRGEALLPGEVRLQGLAYLGRRHLEPFSDDAVAGATALAERHARPIRDAWRLHEATRLWAQAGAAEASDHDAAARRLDELSQLIAGDVRVLLRSIVGMVFRLDRTSGALHAVGFDGPELRIVRRGQVLPPGSGSAGRAVASRAPFVARDYAEGHVQVPPIMTDSLRQSLPFTTLSVPLIVEDEVIGALTVARGTEVPYADHEVQLAEQAAQAAAPALRQAQRDGETVRRQHGAAELSRLAGSLARPDAEPQRVGGLRRLVQGVISLLSGIDAAVWDAHGEPTVRPRIRRGFSRITKARGSAASCGRS